MGGEVRVEVIDVDDCGGGLVLIEVESDVDEVDCAGECGDAGVDQIGFEAAEGHGVIGVDPVRGTGFDR